MFGVQGIKVLCGGQEVGNDKEWVCSLSPMWAPGGAGSLFLFFFFLLVCFVSFLCCDTSQEKLTQTLG